MLLRLLAFGLGFSASVQASFRIYDNYESNLIRDAFGLSDQCLEALLLVATQLEDQTACTDWTQQNITTLCTKGCGASLSSWNLAVEANCNGESVYSNGRYMLAQSIPALWLDGHDLVCLQDRWSPDACYNPDTSAIPTECSDPDWLRTDISETMKDVTRLYDRSLVKFDSNKTYTV
ncbi:carbohydrate-binding module family 18 protein [Penicillium cosmopolitanum]|uniref:Carbohydrate-binding module family 18 protein n=1 Tax=Penicillium cosmopolitanum TaxID=1131564 RepID=A0A9W9SFX3_9EURO|nr:carbohydrate-binding module family 18 protein [Penicillium cosmopolitanum]KAJ5376489.1 carbohydrate-binding module family 18 protein [Penicillium cosmopolitanum]